MVDVAESGILIYKTGDTTAVNRSEVFRDRRKSGRTVIYIYCSIAVAVGGIKVMIKDPSGTFREFQEGPASDPLDGTAGNDMAHFIIDGPFGEGRVDVTTATATKNLYVWFESA